MGDLFATCPHCDAELDASASECPECGGRIGKPGAGVGWRAAVMAAALILGGAGLFLWLRGPSAPEGREMRDAEGRPYIQAPQRTIAPPEDLAPLLRVTALATAPPERVKVVMAQELGATAKIFEERIAGERHFVASAFAPTLGNGRVRIEVMPYKDRVLFVKLRFLGRHPNRAEMLALMGLKPCTRSPSADAMEGPRWTYLEGLDEVAAVYDRPGGPGIREVTVTPNKAWANYFLRGGQ